MKTLFLLAAHEMQFEDLAVADFFPLNPDPLTFGYWQPPQE
jgi:hypothetical protein